MRPGVRKTGPRSTWPPSWRALPIWGSALQGIRQRDFTADIPVSLATVASLLTGPFWPKVVAVTLLVGGLLEGFVAARASNVRESLAALLPDRLSVRRGAREVTVSTEEVQSGDLAVVQASGSRSTATWSAGAPR